MANLQPAGVAGRFYPADPDGLSREVDLRLRQASPPAALEPKAVIAPHAGHQYSGDVAASAYALLARRRGRIRRVVLLAPAHRMGFGGVALSPADAWQTPLGSLGVDTGVRDALATENGVEVTAAPFEGEHALEVHLPFVQRALGEVSILPLLVGRPAAGQVAGILDQLWGGPDTAIVISSDLSHFHDYATARALDAETALGIERLDSSVCTPERACGCFPIRGLLAQGRARDLRVTALDVRNSGDTQGGRDRVVGYGSFAVEYAYRARIGEAARSTLLRACREVLSQAVKENGRPPRLDITGALSPELKAQRATFVTLKIDGDLRGCRGSVEPRRSLIADAADNAWRSGFEDPRFGPLAPEELERLTVEVSILSTPRPIACGSEAELAAALRPDIDGLILREGQRQSLFLPSVWTELPDPAAFVRRLKLKAGLPADHWSGEMQAFRFVTESFGDRG